MIWRHSENPPEMPAWLAMTVAKVDRMIIGTCSQWGPSRKNGLASALGSEMISAPWPR